MNAAMRMVLSAILATSAAASSSYVLAMQKCAGASEFTLHGLWPVAESCPGKPFSDALVKDLLQEMKVDWLSCPEKGGDNEGFWSHEWQKHGTCSGLSEHDFFAAALELRTQYASLCTTDPCRLQCDGPTGPCAHLVQSDDPASRIFSRIFLRGGVEIV